MKYSALIPLLATFMVGSLSFGQTYDFNTDGQLANDFTVSLQGSQTAGNWTQQMAGGLSNTGSVKIGTISTSISTGIILNKSLSASLETFTISTYFQARSSETQGYHFMIGVVPETTSPFAVSGTASDPTNVTQLAVGLRYGTSGFQFGWMNNDTRGLLSGVAGLNAESWYWISTEFIRDGSEWTINMVLREASNSGELGSVVLSNTVVLTNAAISDSETLHPIFAMANSINLRVVDRIDNFTVIPEPSSTSMLLGGLVGALALLQVYRRRR